MAGQKPRRFNQHLQNIGQGTPAGGQPPAGASPQAGPVGTPPLAPGSTGTSRKGRHLGTRGFVIVLLFLTCVVSIIGIFYGGSTSINILGVCAVLGAGATLLPVLVNPIEVKDFFDRCDKFFKKTFSPFGAPLKWLTENRIVSIFSLSLNIVLLVSVSIMLIFLTHPSPFMQDKVRNTANATPSSISGNGNATATPLITSSATPSTPSSTACTASATPKEVASAETNVDIPCTSCLNDSQNVPQDQDLRLVSSTVTQSRIVLLFNITQLTKTIVHKIIIFTTTLVDGTTEESYTGNELHPPAGGVPYLQPQSVYVTFDLTSSSRGKVYTLYLQIDADRYANVYQQLHLHT